MISPRTGFPYLDEVLRSPGSVLAMAHRGGASHPGMEGLENTLSAFRTSAGLGYHYLETDVQVTRDGVLLAFHDIELSRVSDRAGAIEDLTLDEVRRAVIGGRESVPTLEELLDAFPDARFNIDVKSEASVDALAALIAARGAWDRVLVGSFSPRRTNRFRRLTQGRVATCAHPLEVVAFRLAPSARLARLLTRGRVVALQVPHRRGALLVVTPGFVRRAQAAGAHVHVWTIDDADEMRELLDRGVDGIITDRTDILRSVLSERGQWLAGRTPPPGRDDS